MTDHPVRQLRVVVEAEDYEAAVHFDRDVLGLPEELVVDGDGGARVTILDAGPWSPPAGATSPSAIESWRSRSSTPGLRYQCDHEAPHHHTHPEE